MKTKDIYVSKDGGAIGYHLDKPAILGGQRGWHCEVYQNVVNEFYVGIRGAGNSREIYTGRGFIAVKALERFCEPRNDIILMAPYEQTHPLSRN